MNLTNKLTSNQMNLFIEIVNNSQHSRNSWLIPECHVLSRISMRWHAERDLDTALCPSVTLWY